MTTKIVLDKAGRVVIPKTLREELHLSPGDSLELESQGEQITLRPVRGTGPLQKEDGVWVFRTGLKLPASTTEGPKLLGEWQVAVFNVNDFLILPLGPATSEGTRIR